MDVLSPQNPPLAPPASRAEIQNPSACDKIKNFVLSFLKFLAYPFVKVYASLKNRLCPAKVATPPPLPAVSPLPPLALLPDKPSPLAPPLLPAASSSHAHAGAGQALASAGHTAPLFIQRPDPSEFITAIESSGMDLPSFIGSGRFKTVRRMDKVEWVIKCEGRASSLSRILAPNEELFYLLSVELNLRVAPETYFIAEHSDFYACLQGLTGDPQAKPISFQRFVQDVRHEIELDIPHAHKALLLNWITGRRDGKRDNSVVESDGKIWEIDNDQLFHPIGDELPWYFIHVQNHPFDASLLDAMLQLPDRVEISAEVIQTDGMRQRALKGLNSNIHILKAAIRELRGESPSNPITPVQLREKLLALRT